LGNCRLYIAIVEDGSFTVAQVGDTIEDFEQELAFPKIHAQSNHGVLQ